MKLRLINQLLPVLLLTFATSSFALKNQITGIGPTDGRIDPYICIKNPDNSWQAVAPGKTFNAGMSGALRFASDPANVDPCDPDKNAYLGWVSISAFSQISYSPFGGVHVAYVNPAVDGNGNVIGQIQYTPIAPNFNLLSRAPSVNATWEFVGFNLSGLEFSKAIDPVVIPNLSEDDAIIAPQFNDLAEVKQLLQKGMNTIRVPISWDFMEWNGQGSDINLGYYNSYVKPLLETLTNAHVNTIIDLHAYMRYSTYGKQYSGCFGDSPCPDGKLIVDPAAYIDIWRKIYNLVKNDPKININYIMFDLMNEPVNVPNDSVFTLQTAVIRALRQQGFTGYILMEGNSWTGLHSWTTDGWTGSDGKTYTNATLFTKENFAKEHITDLSKIIINVHQYLDSDFSGTHDVCQTNLNANNFNLPLFVDYLRQNHLKAIVTEFGGGKDSSSCRVAMRQFLDYLKDNSAKNNNNDYGFVGWTIWGVGHGWGDYNLRVTPTSYQMQVMQDYLQPISAR